MTHARNWSDGLEEGFIAFTMFAMTAITFANVVARYVFNSNILWAVEATVALFAWLVLIGASYAVKKTAHLGVDVVVNAVSSRTRRVFALVAIAACLVWAVIFVWSSIEYWWPFVTKKAFFETSDLPMPGFLQFLAELKRNPEPYEKMPRMIPYLVLPIASLLLLFRFVQVGYAVVTGRQDVLVAGHEVEEMIDEVRERDAAQNPAESVR